MRIGLLGTGRMAAIRAIGLRDEPDVSVVIGGDPERAQRLAREAGCEYAGGYDDVLAGDVDGLIVANETDRHLEALTACLQAGVPVFCEKPLSLDRASAAAIAASYAQAGIQLQIGFHRRFDAGFIALRDAIRSGEVGDLFSIVLTARDAELPPAGYVATSGGIFRDMHIHDFDSAVWLSDRRVRAVHAFGSCLTGGEVAAAGDADVTAITLELEGHALVSVHGARRNAEGYDSRAEVYGSRASLALGLGTALAARRVCGDASPRSTYGGFAERYADAYTAETRSFLALCAQRADNLAPAEASVSALAIAEACEESVRTRTTVVLAEEVGL